MQAIIKSVKLEQRQLEWVAEVVYLRSDEGGEHRVSVPTGTYYFSTALIGLPRLIEEAIKGQGVDEVLIAATTKLN